MAFGEVGSIRRGGFGDGEVVRIDFTEALTSPIIHLSSTNAGGNEFSLRVISVDANGFNFRLEEWEDEDGPHGATETITWIAVEPGVHTLPDGRIVEAGTTIATTTSSSVSLAGGFTDTPVVLTNVMSANDGDVVDSDPFNTSSTGFDVRLQEGSLSDGVNTGETVGYIAIETGGDGSWGYATNQSGLDSGNTNFALGGALTDGAVLAETQTVNETDAGNVAFANTTSTGGTTGTIRLRFDEESGDGETAHGNEDVGIVGFERGLLLCLTKGTRVLTPNGSRPVEDLMPDDLVVTLSGESAPVRHILKRHVTSEVQSANPKLCPIRISAGALGNGLPRHDLLVSRQHRMLVRSQIAQRMFGASEVLVAAIRLTELPGIFVEEPTNDVTYIHLMFDTHEVIFAEGAATESLLATRAVLKSFPTQIREEFETLFPDLLESKKPIQSACPIPSLKHQKRLVARHAKNRRALLSTSQR